MCCYHKVLVFYQPTLDFIFIVNWWATLAINTTKMFGTHKSRIATVFVKIDQQVKIKYFKPLSVTYTHITVKKTVPLLSRMYVNTDPNSNPVGCWFCNPQVLIRCKTFLTDFNWLPSAMSDFLNLFVSVQVSCKRVALCCSLVSNGLVVSTELHADSHSQFF